MCDVSIPIDNEETKQFKTNLSLRTLFHVIYVLINSGVALYGGYIALSMKGEVTKIPLLKEMQKFVLFFFTNWNYVST